MRPIKVEFQAFGPYAGHETVDFESLSSKGLFLICGNTGTGKTMILDAMTFALYGKSSGHGRDEFEAMRCTNADFSATTFVKFEFEDHGRFYLFERRLERKRVKLAPSYNLMEREEGGRWQVVLENAKDGPLTAKAIEIIGLNYEQFCQVIILPQGKFEKLLTSGSDKKEEILTSIFGEYRWQRIAEHYYAEAEGRKNDLKAARERIRTALADEQCETIAQLEEVVAKKNEELRLHDEQYEKEDHEKKIKDLQELLATAKRFSDLHRAGEKVAGFSERKDERARWESTLTDAKKADKVRLLLKAETEAKTDLVKREGDLERAKEAVKTSKERSEQAAAKLKEHTGYAGEIEDHKTRIIQYEEKRKDYESIDKAGDELDAKRSAAAAASKEAADAGNKYEDLTAAVVSIREEYERLSADHSRLLGAYLEGITGELARELIDGQPCPVCGSTEHPHKAKAAESSVTKEEVDEAKEKSDEKYRKLNDQMTLQNDAKKVLDEKTAAAAEAASEVSVAEAALENLRKNLVEGVDDLKQLDDVIKSLGEKINDFEKTKKDLEADEKTATDEHKEALIKKETAAKEAERAKAQYSGAAEAVDKSLADNDIASREEAQALMMSSDDMEKLAADIAKFDAEEKTAGDNLRELAEELKGKNELDEEETQKKLDEAIDKKTEHFAKRERIVGEIERLTKKAGDLKKEGDGIEERMREAEEDFAFAKKLRGDTGTGLQRYVLGIMFSSVVAAANRMLEMVHGGRYRLFRCDDKVQGSNKRGLELKVYDRNSGEHEGRFVNTLSGGEKFLASLALSIGMSNIARKTGIRMEALFIDEGFGSLDDESIADAMSVLSSIQESSGLVGIISHVQILQDQIPSKLRVEADEGGSRIVQTMG